MNNNNHIQYSPWAWLDRFFISYRFPVFMILTLFFFWVFMVFMAFFPIPDDAWGGFALEFRKWCFGYDPETGSMEYMYVVMFTLQPLFLSGFLILFWYDQFKVVLEDVRVAIPQLKASLLLVGISVVTFPLLYNPPPPPTFEFRSEDLRTQIPAPNFTLINTDKEPVELKKYEGKVVLITSIYLSCTETCPLIIDQLRATLDSVDESQLANLEVLIITMQPEKDTPEMLARVEEFYRADRYPIQMLSGEPDTVHKTLDLYGVSRIVDEQTGNIGHVNLFVMIDAKGEIAFRFSLGDSQQDWMAQALQVLLTEKHQFADVQ